MGWDCLEECAYQCIWPTVDDFESKRFGVPKFYGKVFFYKHTYKVIYEVFKHSYQNIVEKYCVTSSLSVAIHKSPGFPRINFKHCLSFEFNSPCFEFEGTSEKI